ncbi:MULTISPECIES: efflux transporter outer membrane subunit [Ramlibacter]|uniref:Efflux transporter outer membrane subunit n=2 Tax=Ramlibacter aquaticus TaxID=2780094 RepID=A0ABR9SFB0_9BURK|nr:MULTISPECIES: efflux transporter outer membrane subunit [Ramlibacter]MBE7940747.1 efflux transporter outer membrane subunit [Ramlibacter aquaticus]
MKRMTFPFSRLAPLAAALALAGCASTGGIAPQAQLRSPESLGLAAPVAASAQPAAPLHADWWREFGDAQLDALMDKALQGNPNLRAAQARVERAQAMTGAAQAALLPKLGGELDAQRQKLSANSLYPPPYGGAVFNTGTLQLAGNWEIDFFGKNRAALDATLNAAQAARADADAARVLLSTNVARAWFQLARIDDQLEVARRTLAQREESLKLVQDRVHAGLDTTLELRQSEGSLPEARQQIEALSEQAEIARHALAALAGLGNQPLQASPSLATARRLGLPAALPADLLGQRADIAAARWRVEAAGAEIRNARAQFYPNVNLVAFAGLSSFGLDRLLHSGSEQWGVGPAIRLPIFEGGQLRANLRGKSADYDAAVESYNAALLDAIRDTADQVSSSRSIERQQAEQQQAAKAAEDAYQIAVQRYKAGLGTYLNVLSAETAVLAQRRLAVDLAGRALDTQVSLVRALGGGWQPAAPAAGTDLAAR